MRVDLFVFEKGFAKSREAARKLIKDGSVMIDGRIISKPSWEIDGEILHKVDIVGEILPYVSRGGLKLEKALEVFGIDVTGACAIDIGASTGGFTDCLLQHGAASVRAVDVGRSQLDKSLLNDDRVRSYEGINARYVTPDDIGGIGDIVVCDVSFISLTLIIPAIKGLLTNDGRFIALIKPQFEAGRENVGKNGIVRNRDTHLAVIKRVLDFAAQHGLYCSGLTVSPIEGGDGNREYLALFDSAGGFDDTDIGKIVYSK